MGGGVVGGVGEEGGVGKVVGVGGVVSGEGPSHCSMLSVPPPTNQTNF